MILIVLCVCVYVCVCLSVCGHHYNKQTGLKPLIFLPFKIKKRTLVVRPWLPVISYKKIVK